MEKNIGYSVYSVFVIFMCVLELLHTKSSDKCMKCHLRL
jgi:hypothetical protein